VTITRAPRPESNFYILDKQISEDKRLSWGARGLLIFLLGKPDSWSVSINHLRDETKSTAKPTGRDGVYGLLDELIQSGYVIRSQERADSGGFAKNAYTVRESPLPDLPYTANPYPANPTLVSTDKNQGLNKIKTSSPKRLSDDTFDVFWKVYPKKVSKADALKAWKKIDADLLSTISAALLNHMNCEQWVKDNGQFIPNAATWLNKQKWEDEVKPYVAGQPNTGTSGQSRTSLVDRVRQANAHLLDDEPLPYVDDRDWPEFDGLREVDGQVVGSDDGDVRP